MCVIIARAYFAVHNFQRRFYLVYPSNGFMNSISDRLWTPMCVVTFIFALNDKILLASFLRSCFFFFFFNGLFRTISFYRGHSVLSLSLSFRLPFALWQRQIWSFDKFFSLGFLFLFSVFCLSRHNRARELSCRNRVISLQETQFLPDGRTLMIGRRHRAPSVTLVAA